MSSTTSTATSDQPAAFDEVRSKLQTIGASDSPAILGVSPWQNALGLALQKKQALLPTENKAMRMGKVMENTIASLYQLETGKALKGSGQDIHVSPFWPWMHATPDRWREDGLLVEIKNTAKPEGWGAEYTDHIPEHYKVQCQHQMAVLNCDRMHVGVLISGNDFRVYELERDHAFVERLVQICKDFYEKHVIGDALPEMDFGHPGTLDALRRLNRFDPSQSVFVAAGSPEEALFAEYLGLVKQRAQLVERMDEIKGRILGLMGDAGSAACVGSGHTARRRVVGRAGYEVKPSSYVRLDVHERKDKA